MSARLDPITFEVIRNALLAAAEEMAIALRRSAYSTNIKTRADFSCAYFDPELRVVAPAFTQPIHLGSLVELVPTAVRAYRPERLGHGDALLTNHPYLGGVHLNDITLISPVHHADELVGYVASLAHHVDVGGGAPASIGAFREVYQEGVIIPPVRLVHANEIVDDVFRLVLAQVRSKRETAGDLRAQVAANTTGARRVGALLDRFGRSTVAAYTLALIDYAERRARAAVATLPRGEYAAEGFVDDDGFTDRPVRLRVRVVIDERGVLFDLSGSDEQRRAPVNSTFAQTYSACAYALKALIDPDVPANAGFYRLVRVAAPEGTVVNCRPPAPVVGGWETQMRLTDLIFKALAPALPDRVPAGTKGMICHAGFGGIHPRTGEYYCFLETVAGGYGARRASDGPDAVQPHGQNTENAPVEETELNYPVRITRYELIDDSEGAGRTRGGLGLRRDYHFPDHAASFTVLADRTRWGPHGLFGGQPGAPARYVLNPDRDGRELGAKTTLELAPGDVVSYRTCGGGGYGPPAERDPGLVLQDVREGKVSPARAREVYRVAVDTAAWRVDEAETARLRAAP
ncbi:MAG TPA: hydantoinase B/oxoprolinase family protein [Chloroflexota bacterium]|nr:hydantoinase B/oxoprolinase family protein [Chloroflexota bacterium]